MAETSFKENIKKLNFTFMPKVGESGVLLTANYQSLKNKHKSPDVLFALETASKNFGADAVYFRFFSDGRGAVPQVYIYDYTEKPLTETDKKEIHINVWSGCQVPIYIIIGKSEVNVFDAREKIDIEKENLAFETIQLTGEVVTSFSQKSFDDGLFWEEQNEERFKFENSAYRDLITGLKKVYIGFQEESGLDSHVALKLLVQCLLIKYLEERDDDSSNGYFAETYFKKHFKCENFCDVIRKGKLLHLLDQLAEDFNGKIFEWDKREEIEARNAINKSEVKNLAYFLDANIQDDQYVLWKLYSFSRLPVELISSVYEALLTDSKDIVYTPEMLVSVMVDECMPLKSPRQDFKLIDVSCGSGIFLVKAYKRIIQWWRYEQWEKTEVLKKPSLDKLKKLLLDNIYGIDIQEDAIRLSVFSLALALLDEVDLTPPIWHELKFPDLGKKNILTGDFFKFISDKPSSKFDLVIGNPPFNLPEIDGKEPPRKEYFKDLNEKIKYTSEIAIPDENPALHFLVQSMKLLKSDAILCLIQPSGPLFYQKDTDFKQSLFSKYNLLEVIDFTNLSNVLWGENNVATAAIFLQNSKPDQQDAMHMVAKRTSSNVNRLFLEFDHYDFNSVSKEDIIHKPYVWKANLLGGGRIGGILDRLSQLETLEDFLLDKKKTHEWEFAEGFTALGSTQNPCDYITDQRYLPSEAFCENRIDWQQVQPCEIQLFHRPKDKKIYTEPHLLIKENIGKKHLSVHLSDEYMVFRANIIGIHCPKNQRPALEKIMRFFVDNNDLLRFWILSTSSQLSVSLATVPLKKDFMNIPYSDNPSDLKISSAEKIIIDDILTYQFSGRKKSLFEITQPRQVGAYSKIFCKTLNSIYQTKDKAFRLFKILDAGKYYALHFEYTDNDDDAVTEVTTDLEKYIQSVIPTSSRNGSTSHTQRILKVFGKDRIVLAKPKQLRYWLPSIALRDADEVFEDYLKARYSNA